MKSNAILFMLALIVIQNFASSEDFNIPLPDKKIEGLDAFREEIKAIYEEKHDLKCLLKFNAMLRSRYGCSAFSLKKSEHTDLCHGLSFDVADQKMIFYRDNAASREFERGILVVPCDQKTDWSFVPQSIGDQSIVVVFNGKEAAIVDFEGGIIRWQKIPPKGAANNEATSPGR